MKWRKANDRTVASDDDRYWVTRTGIDVNGAPGFVYQAIRLGKPWRSGGGFDGSIAIGVCHVGDDEAARRVALDQLLDVCEEDARHV